MAAHWNAESRPMKSMHGIINTLSLGSFKVVSPDERRSSWRHAFSRPLAIFSINAIIIISFSLCFESKRLVFLISFLPRKTTVYWINFIRIDTASPFARLIHILWYFLLQLLLSKFFIFLIHLALFILCCYFFFHRHTLTRVLFCLPFNSIENLP